MDPRLIPPLTAVNPAAMIAQAMPASVEDFSLLGVHGKEQVLDHGYSRSNFLRN